MTARLYRQIAAADAEHRAQDPLILRQPQHNPPARVPPVPRGHLTGAEEHAPRQPAPVLYRLDLDDRPALSWGATACVFVIAFVGLYLLEIIIEAASRT